MTWQRVAAAEELGEGEMLSVTVAGRQLALFRVEGKVYATDSICTHAFADLTEGTLDGFEIECPLHQGLFDIRSGAPLEGPVEVPLVCYAVREEAGEILVEI